MRPRLQTARDELLTALRQHRGCSAQELASTLGVSVPTVHRLLAEAEGQVVRLGQARRTRHAALRPLRHALPTAGAHTPVPVYEVLPSGRAQPVSTLLGTAPFGTASPWPLAPWPMPTEAVDGWWDGLPWPLQDMRPQGYLGRQLARREHQALGLSPNPAEWDDDDVLHALQQRGEDCSGSLLVGAHAHERWMQQRLSAPPPLAEAHLPQAYAQLAEQAVAQGVPGSSAAGEFPKFSARRQWPGRPTPHVLVKFSGADASPTVQRWADLLVCEHLALQTLQQQGLGPAAHTRVLQHGGRTFLEIERFDRHGDWGRSRLCSLDTVQGAFLGSRATDWPSLCAQLHQQGWLSAEQRAQAERWWWFGRLIANTDMHLGNLGLVPGPGLGAKGQAGFVLAPAYDMLPMLYAPLAGGEVPPREFEPPWPLPEQRPAWQQACRAALQFWRSASTEARLSAPFRAVCATNLQRLEALHTQV